MSRATQKRNEEKARAWGRATALRDKEAIEKIESIRSGLTKEGNKLYTPKLPNTWDLSGWTIGMKPYFAAAFVAGYREIIPE